MRDCIISLQQLCFRCILLVLLEDFCNFPTHTHRLVSPPLSNQHKMVLKLLPELEAAVGVLKRWRLHRLKLRLLSPPLPIVIGGSRSAGACR